VKLREMKADELQDHIFTTYKNLRWGMALIGFAFPLGLFSIGKFWYGIAWQNSMSAYYFAESNGEASMRSWFVGILFVLGFLLYLYKGFSKLENYLLNVAGVCALGVALFPMEWNCGTSCQNITIHGISAVVLFLSIAFVAIQCAKDTLHLLNNQAKEKRYLRLYRFLGALMIVSPLFAFTLTVIIHDATKLIFLVEASGIWAFAGYWGVKSWELWENQAEKRALEKDPTVSREPPEQIDSTLAKAEIPA